MTADLSPDHEALAPVIIEAMRKNGWIVPPSFGLYVADAVLAWMREAGYVKDYRHVRFARESEVNPK